MKPDAFAFSLGLLVCAAGLAVAFGALDHVSARPGPWVAGMLAVLALALLVGPVVQRLAAEPRDRPADTVPTLPTDAAP